METHNVYFGYSSIHKQHRNFEFISYLGGRAIKAIDVGDSCNVVIKELSDGKEELVLRRLRLHLETGAVQLQYIVTSHDQRFAVIRDAGPSISTIAFNFDHQLVQHVMFKLLLNVAHLHCMGILHGDLNPSHVLISPYDNRISICGFARAILPFDNISSYTPNADSLCYMAPEVLRLSASEYSEASDLWSIGCIMVEILIGRPLFSSCKNMMAQFECIFELLGAPSWPSPCCNKLDHIILSINPSVPHTALDLICNLLIYNPNEKITALDAIEHDYFSDFDMA